MGTASTTKFIKNNAGVRAEEAAVTTSAGSSDAQKIVALNAEGVLDSSIVNAVAVSTGVSDVDKIPKLGSTGRLDESVMPVGIGADTASIIASEALAAGDLVNIYNVSSVANCRKADGSTSGKEAHGFVLAAVAVSASATVYFEGSNGQCSGLTPGKQYLSGTTAGKSVAVAPSGSNMIIQAVGFATDATTLNFQSGDTLLLA